MSLQLSIPDSVIAALRVPEPRVQQTLLVELAIALYQQNILSFGKSRELAQLDKYEFGQLLGTRHIERHYTEEDLSDDLDYAGC